MFSLLRRNRKNIPLIGDMLCSLLVFPIAFTLAERWFAGLQSNVQASLHQSDALESGLQAGTSETVLDRLGGGNLYIWICALYALLALIQLFRAFRLRRKAHSLFVSHLIYSAVLAVCAALPFAVGYNSGVCFVISMSLWVCLLADRVISIVRRHKPWAIAMNIAVICVLLFFMVTVLILQEVSMLLIPITATFYALLSIMAVTFSRINTDVLGQIVRKTYAGEIITGLLLLMVAFSYMLKFTDESFTSFWDALWYCFAVVTTIGFGDLTPTSSIGRVLSVILGIYGIVVVALITSIIVNFYGEMKKSDAAPDSERENAES